MKEGRKERITDAFTLQNNYALYATVGKIPHVVVMPHLMISLKSINHSLSKPANTTTTSCAGLHSSPPSLSRAKWLQVIILPEPMAAAEACAPALHAGFCHA